MTQKIFGLYCFLGMKFGYEIELQYIPQKHVYISHFPTVTKHGLMNTKVCYSQTAFTCPDQNGCNAG